MSGDAPGPTMRRRPSPFPRVEPEIVEPEIVEPEAVEPEAVEPEAVEPEAVEPEAVEPEAVEAEPEAVGAAEPGGDAASFRTGVARVGAFRGRVITAGVLLVLIVLLGLVVLDRAGNGSGGSGITSEQRAALARADLGATHLWSYDYRALDSDVSAALVYATPTFQGSFKTLVAKVVKPTAVANHVVVTSRVTHSAVVSSTASTVVALLYADQTVSSKAAKTSTQIVSARVTMLQVHGTWLVDNVVSL